MYLFKFIWLIEIRDFPRGEDVIDVLQEALLDHLRIVEEEDGGLVLHASLVVQVTQVLPELLLPVVTGDLDLEDRVLDDVGGQSTQALTATPPHAHQQHVPTGLSDHSNNTTN